MWHESGERSIMDDRRPFAHVAFADFFSVVASGRDYTVASPQRVAPTDPSPCHSHLSPFLLVLVMQLTATAHSVLEEGTWQDDASKEVPSVEGHLGNDPAGSTKCARLPSEHNSQGDSRDANEEEVVLKEQVNLLQWLDGADVLNDESTKDGAAEDQWEGSKDLLQQLVTLRLEGFAELLRQEEGGGRDAIDGLRDRLRAKRRDHHLRRHLRSELWS